MAAGLGFKDFTTGEVLTAADVDGYLMQGIWVFASTAARDAAVTAPAEGNFAFTKDTNSLWYYDGAAWVASGATGDIEGVTAGTGISGGGTSGTVTITNSMATAIDSKGDLVVGTGADAFSRLAVGANGTTLVADSAEATGLKWAASSSGGMTLLSTTSCSGSTITVSSISQSYNSLEIWIYGLTWGTAGNVIWFYPYDGNTFETDAIYNTSSTGVATIQNNGLKITPAGDGTRTGGFNCWTITIDNYASSSNRKPISFYGGYNDGVPVFGHGLLTVNSALSSFVLATNNGYTFDGGTIKVYGVK